MERIEAQMDARVISDPKVSVADNGSRLLVFTVLAFVTDNPEPQIINVARKLDEAGQQPGWLLKGCYLHLEGALSLNRYRARAGFETLRLGLKASKIELLRQAAEEPKAA